MFDKFGEFDSAEELNRAAAAQKAEGDEEALKLLAKENGIDEEDAEDYMDDVIEELATPLIAAVGKIKVEKEALKLEGVLNEWCEELITACTDHPEMAVAVRKKGKDLAGYIAQLAEYGFKNKALVSSKIVQLCGKDLKSIVGNHPFYIGVPDKTARKMIMQKYYLG